jgi:hypothetical protein
MECSYEQMKRTTVIVLQLDIVLNIQNRSCGELQVLEKCKNDAFF